ncbi:PDZ domain-containing protein [Cohnella nanjingensis]|uniref:PDZ domain-containing protein n=2 Tax=Cohnella nanjingensis TaxID=1387779 RepID=A0A7X0RP20_9BACL|nr:PDZ domain-containing protein [Cohnella nanjingensis]
MSREMKRGFRRYRAAIIVGLIAIILVTANYWSWPYVLYGPGSAEPVHPRVETDSKLNEKGSLLFTTVSTYSKPNLFSLAYAWLNPRMDIQTEAKATGGAVNMGAYRNLLAWMRDSSEANALLAAYSAMKRTIKVDEQGVIVYQFLKETEAREHGLQEGDIITSVDGKKANKAEELSGYLAGKKVGDAVKLAGTRGGKPFEATVPLIKMSTGKPGVGFVNQTVLKVTPPDKVQFDFNDTGGPSAGLMMTLEIIAQLKNEDLTKGYRIAGTGTIAADGSVGLIGGIQYKLMAADREKADYFLVPYTKGAAQHWDENQKIDPEASINAVLQGFGNWSEAQKTVADLKLSPKLVPVSSLQDALDFLNKLEPKKAADAKSTAEAAGAK